MHFSTLNNVFDLPVLCMVFGCLRKRKTMCFMKEIITIAFILLRYNVFWCQMRWFVSTIINLCMNFWSFWNLTFFIIKTSVSQTTKKYYNVPSCFTTTFFSDRAFKFLGNIEYSIFRNLTYSQTNTLNWNNTSRPAY